MSFTGAKANPQPDRGLLDADAGKRELDLVPSVAAAAGDRIAALQAITTALASALSIQDVGQVVTDGVIPATGARHGILWLVDEGGTEAKLVRAQGLVAANLASLATVPLSSKAVVADSIRERRPLVVSADEYVSRYAAMAEKMRACVVGGEVPAIACYPLVAGGRTGGALLFGFDPERVITAEDHGFFQLVAEHCAQALHRARLYAAEQRAVSEAALLYALLDGMNRATTAEQVYDVAIDGVCRAANVQRAAILLYDRDGVMRFKAWRGLSDSYRAAVEGHSPWSRDVRDPSAVVVPDVKADHDLVSYLPTFARENIAALGFIPLVHLGNLIGKFMLYDDRPRTFRHEMRLVETIAAQVASGVARKQAEAELQEARAAAEQASRTKDEFLAVVSHELRTPLSTIAGWVSLLRKGRHEDPALLAKALEVIDRNVHAQTTIIEDILDVSRVITGKLVLEPRLVSMVTVVEEALESIRMSAAAKEIALSLDAPDEPFTVVGDPDRLRQIVWNLLSNAIKFTPAAGTVSVRLRRESDRVNVQVVDSGKGIDPAFLPFVFDRFRQADSSTTRRHTGLGLGLAIVRHLAELHGGDVRVESPGEGKGATFTVSLPIRAVYRRSESPERKTPVSSDLNGARACRLEGVRVLVVDDDADAREMLAEILSAFGAEPTTADSVRAGLEALLRVKPQILVSDIGMPIEDGTVLVRKLREEVPGGDRLPAVALTAYAREEEAKRALEAGFDRHVAKPANPDSLVKILRELVDRR